VLRRQRLSLGPGGNCPLRHPPHFEPSLLGLNGIRRSGEPYLPGVLPQRHQHASRTFEPETFVSYYEWNTMTWRPTAARPCHSREHAAVPPLRHEHHRERPPHRTPPAVHHALFIRFLKRHLRAGAYTRPLFSSISAPCVVYVGWFQTFNHMTHTVQVELVSGPV
jgi:hypothetical protein